MKVSLRDRTVLITGASSGIGRSLALALAERDNRVIVCARSVEALEELARLQPGRILPLPWDITDAGQLPATTQRLAKITAHIDVAILNAGTCEYVDVRNFDPALARRVMDTNFGGMVNSLALVLPLLRHAPRPAHLVGISSLSTFVPMPRAEAYGASKAALRYFLDSLRVDLHVEGIDVSVVSPGFVRTPLTDRNDFDMPFLMEAEDAAGVILRGIERRRAHIVFPRRLAWPLALLNRLPARLWARLGQFMVRKPE